MRARRFAERYTDDERLLSTLELHDRPYSLWRRCGARASSTSAALPACSERLADPALFLRFVELDGSTEGKNPEPVSGWGSELRRRGAL